jgi:hypothetical protein
MSVPQQPMTGTMDNVFLVSPFKKGEIHAEAERISGPLHGNVERERRRGTAQDN